MFKPTNAPKASFGLLAALFLAVSVLAGCQPSDLPRPESQPLPESEAIREDPAETSPENIDPVEQKTPEEQFVLLIMDAINQDDTSVLLEHYDSLYGEVQPFEREALPGGLELYHTFLQGEKLVHFEYDGEIEATHDPPGRTDKRYVLTSENGITRDLKILCYEEKNGEVTYRYDDPLLFYGAETYARATRYIEAIQSEDVGYLYDYLRIVYEDGEALPFSDPARNETYVAWAEGTVAQYQTHLQLETMTYRMSGAISAACDHPLFIEILVTGLDSQNAPVEHSLQGVFEFPIWAVQDPWSGIPSS